MPSLARKIIVCAAVDGLILQPLSSKKDQRPSSLVRIKYGDGSVSSVSKDAAPDTSAPNSFFEAFGIVGLVTVFNYSYLISITRRQQVAQIRGLPIYVVTEVALTPCSSQKDASEAIAKTAAALTARANDQAADDEDSGDDTAPESRNSGDDAVDEATDLEETDTSAKPTSSSATRTSIAEDVISRRGSYGRFAQRWFSKAGWTQDQKRNMGLSPEQSIVDSDESGDGKETAGAVPKKIPIPEEAAGSEAARALLPRLLRSTQILFGTSRTFYYSYDYDITRNLASGRTPATALAPLHNQVDQKYFWNRHIMQPFIDAGADSLALPLMQGFVGQRSFVVDGHPPQTDEGGSKGGQESSVEMSDFASSRPGSTPASPPPERVTTTGGDETLRPSEKRFDITIISRRSTLRAGLRYLRRGIDEQGNVANAVESEQILSVSPTDGAFDTKDKVYSFVQIRGSFPLFFTQSPYSLKPTPMMQHSPDANFAALKKHFDALRKQYGQLQIVNLVEKHGVESTIGVQYEKNIDRLNEDAEYKDDKVAFEWFDFHSVCRGMKFENVSFLLQTLGPKLESFGYTVVVDSDSIQTRQKGVLRTNCMDCLDRTNVCQSSFAKYMLDLQLKDQGFDMSLQRDQENSWFNTLWADNGDAISKQYASTGAMKGDYTRTRKRNYRGALTDAGLSLTRLFNGMFNDFFLQTTIDFLLGNVTDLVFEEFEANMMTKDPAVSMQNMRQQAIDLCQKRVVADEAEEFHGGWTFLSPTTPDTVRSASLEEVVLLLTDAALYLCRFDWNLDKVSSFERVDLAHVQKIKFGTYITSTISAAQVDEMRNVGMVIEYKPGSTDVTRVNTRSLSSMSETPKAQGPTGIAGFLSRSRPGAAAAATVAPPRKIALKALHSQTSAADPAAKRGKDEPGAVTRLTEIQQVVVIAAEIERLAIHNQPRLAGTNAEDAKLIEKGDIISLAEAKKNTSVLEQLGHSIKKFVWA
ncbi:Phosphatidylinositide phosphatase SAC2 [Echria macrotheca]|uniref:Phosphatidylinositide phosphatase SAC2 n=1 Tax=Echria macrotheca TaxID=438768 RepID=A0AAJ0BA32_9PEZI|nr:Phosphatidylinositide phosphatase SAC2 [Echria macrotheca]